MFDSQANDSWESDGGEESKLEESNNMAPVNRSGLNFTINSSGGSNQESHRDSSLMKKRKGYINLNIFTTEEGVNPIVLPVLRSKPSSAP